MALQSSTAVCQYGSLDLHETYSTRHRCLSAMYHRVARKRGKKGALIGISMPLTRAGFVKPARAVKDILRPIFKSVISRLEDADYEGHSLAMALRIASALEKRVEIRFVTNKLQPA